MMCKSSLTAYAEHPRDVVFNNQAKDEKILLLLRRHPITYLGSVVVLVLMVLTPFLLGAVLAQTALDPALLPVRLRVLILLVWYFLTLGYGTLSFLSWFFNVHLVTDRRVVDLDYFGFMFYRLSETEISLIQDATYQIGGVLRVIFDFGNVTVQTAAEEREFEFEDVPKPAKVHALIMDLINHLP